MTGFPIMLHCSNFPCTSLYCLSYFEVYLSLDSSYLSDCLLLVFFTGQCLSTLTLAKYLIRPHFLKIVFRAGVWIARTGNCDM